MAYQGATSTSPNQPVALFQPMGFGRSAIGSTTYGAGSSNIGGIWWAYTSTHLQTDVGSSDFINDGAVLGMRVKDVLFHNSLSSGFSVHRCSAVGSTFASYSAGVTVSSAS